MTKNYKVPLYAKSYLFSLISMLYDGALYIESSGLTFRPVAASVIKGHQAGNQTCKKMSSLLSERICV